VANKDKPVSLSLRQDTSFSREELDVLRYGSTINGRSYLPYLPEIDEKEKFVFQIPFTYDSFNNYIYILIHIFVCILSDKEGKLDLSKAQKDKFVGWARPDEIFDDPKLITFVSSFSVKQVFYVLSEFRIFLFLKIRHAYLTVHSFRH
jgi:calpain-7